MVGAVPFGYLVARLRGVNIFKVGSGNIGATNVFRSVGKGWGILTFALDVAKGLAPTVLLPLLAARLDLGTSEVLPLCAGVASILGHNWSPYLGFRGGKGVATSAGVLLGLAPAAVGAGVAVWLVVTFTTRYVSLGSIAAAIAVATSAWLLRGDEQSVLIPWALTGLAALTIFRHKANIVRLIKGTENRFGKKKPAAKG